jgi:hypothetical protein
MNSSLDESVNEDENENSHHQDENDDQNIILANIKKFVVICSM